VKSSDKKHTVAFRETQEKAIVPLAIPVEVGRGNAQTAVATSSSVIVDVLLEIIRDSGQPVSVELLRNGTPKIRWHLGLALVGRTESNATSSTTRGEH